MNPMDPLESAKELAINYIDYAPRTVAEVRRRLSKAGYDESVVEEVVEHLVSVELLDDSKFSTDWVESRTRSKKIGRIRLAAELRPKGVDSEQADQALESLDTESQVAAALHLARKKVPENVAASWTGPAERAAGKRRLAGYLQRRGYNWEIIEQVFSRIFAKDD
jgi:regulatory protein